MKKTLIAIIIAITLVIVSVLIVTQTKTESDEIKIGVVLPLTGDGAIYGIEIKQGIELAISEINSQGGINNKAIIPIYEDNQGLSVLAVSALQKLIDRDNVDIVIGGAFSTSALAMLPICNKQHILLFSPTASSPELTKPNDYFFRNWPSDTFEGNTMALFAMDNLSLKKIAILYSNSDYGVGLKDVFETKINALGGEVVAEESFSEGMTDFRTQLSKIKKNSPEAIYLVGWYKEFSLILRQTKEMNINAQILSCVTFNKPELLEIAGETTEGVYFTQPAYDPNDESTIVKNFVRSYEQKFGETPGVYAAHGYDAVKLIAIAIEKEGTAPEKVMQGLLSIKDYPGVSGRTTFDTNGDVDKPAKIYVVKNSEFIPVSSELVEMR